MNSQGPWLPPVKNVCPAVQTVIGATLLREVDSRWLVALSTLGLATG